MNTIMNLNLQQMERNTIIQAFKTHPDKIIPDVAKLLGIAPRTLARKIKAYGLNVRQMRNK